MFFLLVFSLSLSCCLLVSFSILPWSHVSATPGFFLIREEIGQHSLSYKRMDITWKSRNLFHFFLTILFSFSRHFLAFDIFLSLVQCVFRSWGRIFVPHTIFLSKKQNYKNVQYAFRYAYKHNNCNVTGTAKNKESFTLSAFAGMTKVKRYGIKSARRYRCSKFFFIYI